MQLPIELKIGVYLSVMPLAVLLPVLVWRVFRAVGHRVGSETCAGAVADVRKPSDYGHTVPMSMPHPVDSRVHAIEFRANGESFALSVDEGLTASVGDRVVVWFDPTNPWNAVVKEALVARITRPLVRYLGWVVLIWAGALTLSWVL